MRCRASRWRSAGARSSRSSGPTARARRRPSRRSAGLLHPREARVTFDGADISKTAAHQLVKLGIGHAPEGPPDLLAADRPREPPDGRVHARPEERWTRTSSACSTCSRGSRSGAPAGRHAVGRRAADAGHRAGAHVRARGCSSSTSRRWASRRSSSSRSSRSSGRSTPRARRSCSSSRTPARRCAIAHRGYVLQTGAVALSGDSAATQRGRARPQGCTSGRSDRPARRGPRAADPGWPAAALTMRTRGTRAAFPRLTASSGPRSCGPPAGAVRRGPWSRSSASSWSSSPC